MRGATCRSASSSIRRSRGTSTRSPSPTPSTTNPRASRRAARKHIDMANAHAPDSNAYYIPHGSPWPIRASLALFAMMLGAVGYLNDWADGWIFLPGVVLLAYMFFGWFSTVIGENQHGIFNQQVDRSFRMGMM